MLTVDASAVGVLLLGATFHDEARTSLGLASLGIFALGPPAIHFARGEIGKGLLSIALRVALPVAGFGIGSLVGASPAWSTGRVTPNEGAGALAGGASAAALDAAMLGWDRWQGSQKVAMSAGWAF